MPTMQAIAIFMLCIRLAFRPCCPLPQPLRECRQIGWQHYHRGGFIGITRRREIWDWIANGAWTRSASAPGATVLAYVSLHNSIFE